MCGTAIVVGIVCGTALTLVLESRARRRLVPAMVRVEYGTAPVLGVVWGTDPVIKRQVVALCAARSPEKKHCLQPLLIPLQMFSLSPDGSPGLLPARASRFHHMSLSQSVTHAERHHAKAKSERLGLRGENLESVSCRDIKTSQLKTCYAVGDRCMTVLD